MFNATQNASLYNGQTDPLKKEKEEYQEKTAAVMAKQVIEDIENSILALTNYEEVTETVEGWSRKIHRLQTNPMVKLVRNGFQVKVGYGAKNEAIPDFYNKNEKGNLELPKFWTAAEAISHLNDIKAAIQDGEVDGQFDQMLASYRERSNKGKEVRQKNKQTLHAVA